MPGKRFLSISEQVAMHLREELLRGRWVGLMPGKHELAQELGLNNKTVEAALVLLEREGLLVGQGPRRRRRIDSSGSASARRSLPAESSSDHPQRLAGGSLTPASPNRVCW